MKNPLLKRIPRQFLGEFGKYLVIFLFMTATIGFVSGFLVAGGSMMQAYDDSFEKYRIENGHFLLQEEASDKMLEALEKEEVNIYPDFYVEEDTDTNHDKETDSTLRIFKERTQVNLICLMEGSLPKEADEIAIDRMYADNNDITAGNTIIIGGKECRVTGLAALSDYSALFSDNSDMMFDAVKFGVAVVTEEGFERFGGERMHYSYSWTYEKAPEDEIEEKEMADDFLEVLAEQAVMQNYEENSISQTALDNGENTVSQTITGFVPAYVNQAIHFTGDDMGGDKMMMIVLLYILIVILAFVFAVTINHTIAKEATEIGTLRANGYTKGEILRTYLAVPMIVTLLAAIMGNVLGYTVFKDMVAKMYYGSYSLPTYETIWNGEAFVLTTVVPLLLMFITNMVSLWRKLSLSPLKFIRRDLRKHSGKKAVRLPNLRFMSRFRLRIIIQNRSSYLTLFVGIVFANILLLFGMMMSPLLTHFQESVLEHMLAEYQYVLKSPVEVEEDTAEKYSITSVKFLGEAEDEQKNEDGEQVTVYGIQKDSAYLKQKLSGDDIYVSEGLLEKYGLEIGDTLKLRETYGKKEYTVQIDGTVEYPAALAIFMEQGQYWEMFEQEKGTFSGYFSNKELTEIPEEQVLSCIQEDDLTKVSRQLDVSMGKCFIW